MRTRLPLVLTLMAWLSVHSAGAAEQPQTPDELTPCPYTQAEIEATLGLLVGPGEAADMEFPNGRDVGCFYQVVGGSTTLAVRQTWTVGGGANPAPPSGARVESIPGDPDGARWTIGGGVEGAPRLELNYNRGKVKTRVVVHGRIFREPEMQPRLLNLKRVP
jgi:hypothetical protein